MPGRILVVDDEEYFRRLVSYVLEGAGYEVLLAASAQDGLRLLKEQRPDAVTIDLMMPGQSGPDLLTAKQTDPSIREVPSLVLTAVGIPADLERAQALGAHATLNKPFSRRQLIEAIQGLIGR